MNYRIKEIYFTQQGEGKNTGKDFVFVRFSGCNPVSYTHLTLPTTVSV